jgi:quinoprotein glucose dehydrogenase
MGNKAGNWLHWIYGGVLVLLGVSMLAGGIELATLGGSSYYLICGLAITASGALFVRRHGFAARLYALTFAATVLWSLWEVGFDGWALTPRLLVLALLGVPLLIVWLRERPHGLSPGHGPRPRLNGRLVAGVVLLLVAIGGGAFLWSNQKSGTSASSVALRLAGGKSGSSDGSDWLNYGGTAGGDRFAPIAQITPNNVSDLKVAWIYRTGSTGPLEVTPIKVGSSLYLCTGQSVVVSLDAETGAQRWRFDPKADMRGVLAQFCRGVVYYHAPDVVGECSERILTNTVDDRLIALDAQTGKL